MNQRVYIWGTGAAALSYINTGELGEENILGFIESKKSKQYFFSKRVYEPQEINKNGFDYILVCVYGKTHAIYQTVLENGLDLEKIVFIDNWERIDALSFDLEYPHHFCRIINSYNNIEKVKELFPVLYKNFIGNRDVLSKRCIPVRINVYDLTRKDSILTDEAFSNQNYWLDYFRYRGFELMANEIMRYDIQGAVAELGVFRGTFSKLINKKFSGRKLYLFDTFDSFDQNEYMYERNKGRCPENFYDNFKSTSVELVLDSMPYPDNCIVRKGLFPETAKGLENEEYAFVSIDVDLEKSMLAGLRYFYPRINRGGGIFVHDYNNYLLEGVTEAVIAYEREIGQRLMKVPLADEGGTLVICK